MIKLIGNEIEDVLVFGTDESWYDYCYISDLDDKIMISVDHIPALIKELKAFKKLAKEQE